MTSLAAAVTMHATHFTAWDHVQEKEAALSQLADLAQRQKACIAASHKERAELAARSADPAQVAALRNEAAALQRRLMDLNALKVTPTLYKRRSLPHGVSDLVHRSCLPAVPAT